MIQQMTRYLKMYNVLVESDSFLWKICVLSEDLNADVIDLSLSSEKFVPEKWCLLWKGTLTIRAIGLWMLRRQVSDNEHRPLEGA